MTGHDDDAYEAISSTFRHEPRRVGASLRSATRMNRVHRRFLTTLRTPSNLTASAAGPGDVQPR